MPTQPDLRSRATGASRSSTIVALATASHFPPTLAVTAFTTALAVSSGRGWGSAAVAAAVLSGQLTVGWSNDYIDRERDRAAGRTDKPVASGKVPANLVRTCTIGAAAACVPLSMLSGWRAGLVHLLAVAVALAYNVWLKRTLFSVVPYAVAFGLLPAFIALGRHHHRGPQAWATIAAGLLGAGAHFLNTLPDLDDDARTGVHGLPHRLGSTGSIVTGTTLLTASILVVAIAPRRGLSTVGLALTVGGIAVVVGVIAATTAGRARTGWHLSLAAAAVTVALYLVRSS